MSCDRVVYLVLTEFQWRERHLIGLADAYISEGLGVLTGGWVTELGGHGVSKAASVASTGGRVSAVVGVGGRAVSVIGAAVMTAGATEAATAWIMKQLGHNPEVEYLGRVQAGWSSSYVVKYENIRVTYATAAVAVPCGPWEERAHFRLRNPGTCLDLPQFADTMDAGWMDGRFRYPRGGKARRRPLPIPAGPGTGPLPNPGGPSVNPPSSL